MSKKISIFTIFLSLGIVFAGTAKAICPLCVIAIGAGLGLSRWLGVDDVVSSVWIGALLVALILWTMVELKKKNWRFPLDTILVSLAYYLLTFVPLYYAGIAGHPLNKIFGVDKIVFGTAIGTVMFLFAHWLHLYLKKKNNDKSFFPYQKVVIPVAVLLLTSLILYLLLTWKII